MFPKPPITRAGRSGWLGHQSTRLKSLTVVGALTLGVAGAAIAAASPASADPAFSFVAVGSDVTENVMDYFAGIVGGGILASYDAVNPLTQIAGETITPGIASTTVAGASQLCSFSRPNGSGAGFDSLDWSYASATGGINPGLTTNPQPGCITLSRSSSGPGSVDGTAGTPGSSLATGNFVYIPFAVDAVTYATGPTAATVASYSFTSTAASPAVFTASGSSYAAGATVELSGTVPGGFSASTIYYVVSPSGDTFSLAATENGTAIAGTSAGSGTVQFFTTTQCVSGTTGCGNVVSGIGTITFSPTGTSISQSADFTVNDLIALYGDCSSISVNSVSYNPLGASYGISAVTSPASPAVFTTSTSNSLTANELVTIGGTLPAPFTAGTSYYVVSPTSSTFELAATSGGSAIASTSASGTYTGTVDTPGNIDLYVPQNGSGTLKFWEQTVGVTSVQPCWHQTIIAGPAAGIAVEEHDGSALASDPIGIAPISIAKWIGMNSGDIIPDVRHGDVLQAVTVGTTAVQPINSSGAMNITGCLTGSNFVQSACFPITREVYNVMDYYEVVDTSPPSGTLNNPPYNAVLAGLFAGSTSTLCRSSFTISNLGFGNLPTTNSAFADQCGSTASTLRVQMNATAAEG